MEKQEAPSRALHEAWKEYPSIIPHHLVSKLDPKDKEAKWVVLEKVHGANFCFVVNEAEVVTARRTAVLPADERFYGWQEVLAKYRPALHDLYHRVRTLPKLSDTTEVCVFGELFGGKYPHTEVAWRDVPKVQDGVFYSPTIDFCAFDIQAVRRSDASEGSCRRVWIEFDRATELFRACGLFHAEALMTGTLAQCLAFDTRINSTIPARLGLPPLETRNQMEGVVIKPTGRVVHLLELGPNRTLVRAIYKKKNPQFDEVNPRCEEQEGTAGGRKKRRQKRRGDEVEREMERYVNVNRLRSLESKVGPVTLDGAERAAREMADDALKDFVADNPGVWAGLDQRGQEIKRKHLHARVVEWLNRHLLEPPTVSLS